MPSYSEKAGCKYHTTSGKHLCPRIATILCANNGARDGLPGQRSKADHRKRHTEPRALDAQVRCEAADARGEHALRTPSPNAVDGCPYKQACRRAHSYPAVHDYSRDARQRDVHIDWSCSISYEVGYNPPNGAYSVQDHE